MGCVQRPLLCANLLLNKRPSYLPLFFAGSFPPNTLPALGPPTLGNSLDYIRNVTLGYNQLLRDLKLGIKGAHFRRPRTCREVQQF